MASKNFFKKIEKEASNAYKKSGLRDIYEKNKSTFLTAGVYAPASLLGVLKDKKRNAAEDLAEKKDNLNREQEQKNRNLDDFLDNVSGPQNPPTSGNPSGRPANPIPTANPGIDPLPSVSPDQVQQTGGVVLRGDEASNDVAKLMAEAELQKKLQTDYAGKNKTERAAMLQDYANLITQQQQRVFGENMPGLYEDLNTRGLLRSSELGNAVSREQAKAAQILQEQVGLQGLNDREAALNEGSGIQNQYYQGRYGAIQRGQSLEDFVRQTKAAQLTGLALQPQQQPAPSAKGGGAVQGAVGGGTIGANFGAPGAVIGAGLGAIGGGQMAGK
jgi:hypothetical protein